MNTRLTSFGGGFLGVLFVQTALMACGSGVVVTNTDGGGGTGGATNGVGGSGSHQGGGGSNASQSSGTTIVFGPDGGPACTAAECTTLDAPVCGPTTHACECSSVVNVGAVINVQQVAAALPTPKGGTLVPGVYVATQSFVYTGVGGATGPTGDTYYETKVLRTASATTMLMQNVQSYTTASATPAPVFHAAAEYTISQTSLHVTVLCPANATSSPPVDEGYDASPTEYRVYRTDGGKSTGMVYTKQ